MGATVTKTHSADGFYHIDELIDASTNVTHNNANPGAYKETLEKPMYRIYLNSSTKAAELPVLRDSENYIYAAPDPTKPKQEFLDGIHALSLGSFGTSTPTPAPVGWCPESINPIYEHCGPRNTGLSRNSNMTLWTVSGSFLLIFVVALIFAFSR